LESEMVGVELSHGVGRLVRAEHLSPLSPINDVRATAEYRMDAARTLVQRALNMCAEVA